MLHADKLMSKLEREDGDKMYGRLAENNGKILFEILTEDDVHKLVDRSVEIDDNKLTGSGDNVVERLAEKFDKRLAEGNVDKLSDRLEGSEGVNMVERL